MKIIFAQEVPDVQLPDYTDSEIEALGTFRFTGQTPGEIISTLVPLVFFIAGLALLVYFLVGGFKLLTSGGNPKVIAAGQKILTNALIGFLIVIAAYWLYQILGTILLPVPGSP